MLNVLARCAKLAPARALAPGGHHIAMICRVDVAFRREPISAVEAIVILITTRSFVIAMFWSPAMLQDGQPGKRNALQGQKCIDFLRR